MNKKCRMVGRLAAIAIVAVIAVLDLSGITAHASSATSVPFDINFSLGSNSTQMLFNWLTTTENAPELQIAKTSDMQSGNFPFGSTVYGSITPVTATVAVEDVRTNTNVATGEYENKVTVSNLASSTSYTYRVGDGTTWSSNYTFTTSDPSKSFSFAAFGDPQIGAGGNIASDQAGWANTLQVVTNKYPSLNFLFSLGDEVDNYDSLATQQAQYLAFFNPSSTQNYLQEHPLIALEGNHDYQMGTYYSYHYNQPNKSSLGQTTASGVADRDGDYWFTYGNTLFMVLNANDAYDTAAHDEFMGQAVAANPNVKWKVAAWHQSAYSEANHAASNTPDDPILFIRQEWPKLMDKYGVDVVFQGHDHSYTRTCQMYNGVPVDTTNATSVTNPKGTVYLTLDSGSGSKYYNFNKSCAHTFSEVFSQPKEPTYSYISVTDSQFTLSTYRTDTGDSIDSYSIIKQSSAPVFFRLFEPSSSSPHSGDTAKDVTITVLATVIALIVLYFIVKTFVISKHKKSRAGK